MKMENVDLVEHFMAIRQQEEHYQCPDYISPIDNDEHLNRAIQLRAMICEWTFQVTDHCYLDREIASISMNFLDRYLSKVCHFDEKTTQLAALTSLFLAVKVNTSATFRVSSLIEMSKNCFKEEHITSMENSILWYAL